MLVKWEYVRVRRKKKIENSVGSFLNFLRKKRLFEISSNTYFLTGVLSDIKSFFFLFFLKYGGEAFSKKRSVWFFFLMVMAISLRGFVNNLNDSSVSFFFRLTHNGRFFHKGFEHYTVR